jgi:predicted metal-binding protein
MPLNDYLKCPGLERTLAVVPVPHTCPICKEEVEIWTDEIKRRCKTFKTMVYNQKPLINTPERPLVEKPDQKLSEILNQMLELARISGASKAAVVGREDIKAEPSLARLCIEPRCTNYGLSPTCPPHVSGPQGFIDYLEHTPWAVFVKIDMPDLSLHIDEKRELGKMMHEMVAALEKLAQENGYANSRAFAGGSCKNLFCPEHNYCQVLKKGGPCRNPGKARPSLSGYGVNTLKLMKAVGWSQDQGNQDNQAKSVERVICGLVLVG